MREDKELFIKMVLDRWNARIKQTDDLLNKLSDEQLLREVESTKRGAFIF